MRMKNVSEVSDYGTQRREDLKKLTLFVCVCISYYDDDGEDSICGIKKNR